MLNSYLLKQQKNKLAKISISNLSDWRDETLQIIGQIFGYDSNEYREFDECNWSGVFGYDEGHISIYDSKIDSLLGILLLKELSNKPNITDK